MPTRRNSTANLSTMPQERGEVNDTSPLLSTRGYQSHQRFTDNSKHVNSTETLNSSSTGDVCDNQSLSKRRQVFLMVTLLSLYGLLSCTSSLLYPFFGPVAKEKGLSDMEIGIVYASYETMRFIGAPIYGITVCTSIF